ncbi:MAG: sigma-54-dependent transcriptional regulator [Desulfobulbaceae bacterium]
MLNASCNISSQPASVLIIDSHRKIYDALARCTDEIGFKADLAPTLQEGLQMNSGGAYDVVLARDVLPDGATCYVIQDLLTGPLPPEIIIYTSQGDPDQAEHALKCGAWDYIIDQIPEKTLPDLLKRALRYRQSKWHEGSAEMNMICHEFSNHGIIGRSKAMQSCLNMVARISQSDANVLITGESGTGKELFATAIHNFSARSKKGMIIVDCAALPPTLVESILFGHAKGSFTGANKSQVGLVKQADGGTLFLDEIGELPVEIQKKFLRVIQERQYRPVGGSIEIKSDFRLIAATNKDLQAMAEEGSFREDLLHRLRTFHLELPSLRSRSADITELSYYFRDNFCKCRKLRKKKFSPDYLTILTQYDWPGNVRELFQAIERSITDAQDSTMLFPQHLPMRIRVQVTRKKLLNPEKTDADTGEILPALDATAMVSLKEARDKAIEAEEKKYLERLLALTDGDIKKCCTIADLSRSRLYDLLKKYQMVK